jgi:hypothetical protein
LAAASHFPLVLSQDFGDATVQVEASGSFWAEQFPPASQSATSHGPTLAAHGWPTPVELHLPWALQMPLPHAVALIEQSAPTFGPSKQTPVAEQTPLLCKHESVELWVHGLPSATGLARHAPPSLHTPVLHEPKLPAHDWPAAVDSHLPWPLQIPFPHVDPLIEQSAPTFGPTKHTPVPEQTPLLCKHGSVELWVHGLPSGSGLLTHSPLSLHAPF